ncbi:MAG: hypothetical protein WBC83_00335 [Minisyncoccia bacterium]
MENIIKQLKNGAKHTRLSASEKAEIKSALFRHVKANPVSIPRAIPSPFNIYNFRNKKSISVLVLGGLLMGSSVSFAAENTVPGDTLFPIKIHVNEAVLGATAITQKAKAEWEIRLVERRLEEVEKLAVTQNVPVEVRQIAEQNLEHYTERVKNRIAKFENDEDVEDALGTASLFSEVLNAHERAISELEDKDGNDDSIGVISTSTHRITTSVDDTSRVDNKSIRDAVEKIREVRGDAERKQKDLKKKYHRDEYDKKDNYRGDTVLDYIPQTQSTPQSSPVIQISDYETDIEVKEKARNDDSRIEEIRETPVTSYTPTTDFSTESEAMGVPLAPVSDNHKGVADEREDD